MASLIRESARPRKPWRVEWTELRRRRTRRFATKKEAERFVGDLAHGERRADTDRVTLSEWLVTWVQTHGVEWQARTRRDRGRYADKWIVPHLGAVRLRELGRKEIRDWRLAMRRQGATPYVANKAVSVLSAALGDAAEDGLITGNPCQGLRKLPREKVIRRQPATLAEVEGIRACVPTARDRAMVSLMAYAGLRPSELRTLSWDDVRPRTLVIRSAAGDDGREKGTKTESIRSVPIVGTLADDLAALERIDGLVIGAVDHDNWAARVWRPARALIDSRATPYSLRHTFASLLIAEGKDAFQVAPLLGHATPALTLSTYGHLFAEAQLGERETLADAAARARHEASI